MKLLGAMKYLVEAFIMFVSFFFYSLVIIIKDYSTEVILFTKIYNFMYLQEGQYY